MAIDFIPITLTAAQAQGLKNYITVLRQAQELGQRVLDIMQHNNDGVSFVGIETLFGLPTGKGQTVFNLVNGSIGSMKGTFQVADATTISQQVG
jgi:hypothetical protein